MTPRASLERRGYERIAMLVSIVSLAGTVLYAGITVGRQAERIERLTEQVRVLQQEIAGVNRHLIEWTIRHRNEP